MEHMKSSSEFYESVNEVIYNFAGRVENIFGRFGFGIRLLSYLLLVFLY